MHLQILKYWKSILVTAVICYLSFAQPNNFEKIPRFQVEYLDKIVHFIMYFVLAMVLLYDRQKNTKQRKYSSTIIILIVFPVLIGGIIEIAQYQWFYPRTGEWTDWLADILGVSLAALVVFLINKFKVKS